MEQDEDDCAAYQLIIGTYYEPRQLVFIDESAFDGHVSHHAYAWVHTGGCARKWDFFIRGKQCVTHVVGLAQNCLLFSSLNWYVLLRYSILPVLSLDEIIALDVIDRPFTAFIFNKFIKGLLDQMNPWPQNNSIIVMDNASIYKLEGLRQTIENRCVKICNIIKN